MRETKYQVVFTTQFKKDYKRVMKRGLKIELLEKVIEQRQWERFYQKRTVPMS